MNYNELLCHGVYRKKFSMKRISIFIASVAFLVTCCQKTVLNEETPDCINHKIIEFKNSSSSCETGKSVYRYVFQGTYVYVFNPGNCGADMMATVYDQECNVLCGLGGIAGNIMCNGEDFGKNATGETLIWEN